MNYTHKIIVRYDVKLSVVRSILKVSLYATFIFNTNKIAFDKYLLHKLSVLTQSKGWRATSEKLPFCVHCVRRQILELLIYMIILLSIVVILDLVV